MSGVLLTSRWAPRTLTASTDDQVKKLLETPPTVRRTFAADDVLTAYVEVYDDTEPATDVTLTAQVTSADGLVVFRSSDRRASSELERGGKLGARGEGPSRRTEAGRVRAPDRGQTKRGKGHGNPRGVLRHRSRPLPGVPRGGRGVATGAGRGSL